MPELPDLLYIKDRLAQRMTGQRISDFVVRQPIVLRNALDRPPSSVLAGSIVTGVSVHSPFLRFSIGTAADLIVNLMLAGRLQLQEPGEKQSGYLCIRLGFDSGLALNICDEQKMAKVYLGAPGDTSAVQGFATRGINILDPSFTVEVFRGIARAHSRRQTRVVLTDHSLLSSIGNAYADEILFEAGIHPKTCIAHLKDEDLARLHGAIVRTIMWGAEEVLTASQPIHKKVRGHMRVRNRHGEPCPRCGTTIRREGVRGYDVFFCPQCQPPTRKHFIEWRNNV